MKISKTALIVLACVSALLLALCILLLTGVIPLQRGMPGNADGPGDVPVSIDDPDRPDRSGEANAAYAQKKDYKRQLDDYFTALKTGDAPLLLSLYHQDFWEDSGLTLSDALYTMEESVEVYALPADSSYEIIQERAPDKETRAAVLEHYPNLTIANIIELDVSYTLDGETYRIICTFFQVDNAWYLYEDIGQLNY
ncbi:MAG: hypothetical protein FWF10_04630 [Clostridiales bacterium]|nr:hypothetical protein [Clostridiales bacterium]